MATATATYPLWVRPYERTNPIDGRNRIRVTKQAFRIPSFSTWVLGDVHGQTDAVNVLSNTEYTLRIALRGYRVEEYYSNQQSAGIQAQITTPDFTTLGYTTQQARSYILHNIAWQINRNSRILNMNGNRFTAKSPLVAFLISSAGGAGTAIGGGSPIAAGTSISVINTAAGIRSITLTEAQATSIKAAAVAGFGDVIANVTWTIGTVDLAAASSVSPAIYDRLMIMGLDEVPVFVDYIPQVKTRLVVGLSAGFDVNTVYNKELVKADEGQGLSRQLDLLYKATAGQRLYSLRHVEVPVIDFPSPIIDGIDYVVYNVNHGADTVVDSLNTVYSPYREIICIPRYSTGTTTNPYIATFDTLLNGWLGSSLTNNAIIALD
jgi:hypothetical protein